ncbi:MAG TPA: hypothetical protein VIY47_12900, partial [Ignavibacteriaceae bacterium]
QGYAGWNESYYRNVEIEKEISLKKHEIQAGRLMRVAIKTREELARRPLNCNGSAFLLRLQYAMDGMTESILLGEAQQEQHKHIIALEKILRVNDVEFRSFSSHEGKFPDSEARVMATIIVVFAFLAGGFALAFLSKLQDQSFGWSAAFLMVSLIFTVMAYTGARKSLQ